MLRLALEAAKLLSSLLWSANLSSLPGEGEPERDEVACATARLGLDPSLREDRNRISASKRSKPRIIPIMSGRFDAKSMFDSSLVLGMEVVVVVCPLVSVLSEAPDVSVICPPVDEEPCLESVVLVELVSEPVPDVVPVLLVSVVDVVPRVS